MSIISTTFFLSIFQNIKYLFIHRNKAKEHLTEFKNEISFGTFDLIVKTKRAYSLHLRIKCHEILLH